MANNRRVLDLWIEIVRAELEALVRVPVTAEATEEIPLAASAYRSQLLFEGPVHGVMYVTASAASLVQLSQLVAGEPVDPHAAWTEEGLEVWQIWLTASSGKLAARLSEEIADRSQDVCTILLRDTTAVDGMHLASATDTTASGAAMQQWRLQAAETEFALSVSVQVKFPGEETPLVPVDESAPANPAAEPNVAAVPVETVKIEPPATDPNADVPLPNEAIASPENRTVTPQGQNGLHMDAPSTRKSAEPPAPDPVRTSDSGTRQRLDLLLDIELEATLRFGALELPLREVLELGPGDVLPLDRHVREPVELVVGDRIVARGEVVLVGGNFALHVTEVAEPRRRLETIRCLF
jgi:flagellar motor switch protein FliN/FliY